MMSISKHGLRACLAGLCVMAIPGAAWADPTPECNVGPATNSTECGVDSVASFDGATAVGDDADALAIGASAVGWQSSATGDNSIALGTSSVASALASTAVGWQTVASGTASTALGHNSDATALGATAVGVSAQATANFATSVGRLANAAFAGSTAIGQSATTTAANQVVLGATGTHVRIGDIAASTAAQQASSVGVATVDANGVLGRNTTLLPAVAGLQADTDRLFELTSRNHKDIGDANDGIAMALAMESPAIPSGAKMALSGGIGYFKSRASFATALSVAVGEKSSVSAGVGYGIKSSEFGARAGFQLAW